MTAANRDVLRMDIDVDLDPATGIAAGTVAFVGGTGRFEDATGSADVVIVFDERLVTFAFLIDGTIDY